MIPWDSEEGFLTLVSDLSLAIFNPLWFVASSKNVYHLSFTFFSMGNEETTNNMVVYVLLYSFLEIKCDIFLKWSIVRNDT